MSRRAKPTRPLVAHEADSTLLPSEDEADDGDFALGSDHDDGSSSDSDSETERPSKKKKVEEEGKKEEALSKEAVDDLWASFNAPQVEVPKVIKAALAMEKKGDGPKKIKIMVEYQFVGETVTQEKEVLADSEEARAWLAKQGSSSTAPAPKFSAVDALFGPDDSTTTSTSDASAAQIASTSTAHIPAPIIEAKPKVSGGGPPRRAKASLSSLAASLAKPAKLNTLEKSKLDWNKYVAKEDLSEDLTRARKDGYLDKMDFLQRTEAKKDEAWEKGKR